MKCSLSILLLLTGCVSNPVLPDLPRCVYHDTWLSLYACTACAGQFRVRHSCGGPRRCEHVIVDPCPCGRNLEKNNAL